jgi:hypothetical protein
LPSTSISARPSPRAMNRGVPPTLVNARTGELTPPGITAGRARTGRAETSVPNGPPTVVDVQGTDRPPPVGRHVGRTCSKMTLSASSRARCRPSSSVHRPGQDQQPAVLRATRRSRGRQAGEVVADRRRRDRRQVLQLGDSGRAPAPGPRRRSADHGGQHPHDVRGGVAAEPPHRHRVEARDAPRARVILEHRAATALQRPARTARCLSSTITGTSRRTRAPPRASGRPRRCPAVDLASCRRELARPVASFRPAAPASSWKTTGTPSALRHVELDPVPGAAAASNARASSPRPPDRAGRGARAGPRQPRRRGGPPGQTGTGSARARPGRARGRVGQHEVGAGPVDRQDGLAHGRVAVEPAPLGGGLTIAYSPETW